MDRVVVTFRQPDGRKVSGFEFRAEEFAVLVQGRRNFVGQVQGKRISLAKSTA
jgi:hypothetical protein